MSDDEPWGRLTWQLERDGQDPLSTTKADSLPADTRFAVRGNSGRFTWIYVVQIAYPAFESSVLSVAGEDGAVPEDTDLRIPSDEGEWIGMTGAGSVRVLGAVRELTDLEIADHVLAPSRDGAPTPVRGGSSRTH